MSLNLKIHKINKIIFKIFNIKNEKVATILVLIYNPKKNCLI